MEKGFKKHKSAFAELSASIQLILRKDDGGIIAMRLAKLWMDGNFHNLNRTAKWNAEKVVEALICLRKHGKLLGNFKIYN